ncbi:MAG: hypothetical protein OYL92_10295 [Acidobacteriota bacterium]|nr:hypothetical protein [Acidobacteriota bacterium]MDE3265349.1 hypothetical protein [Acidobacteriota bacterium]
MRTKIMWLLAEVANNQATHRYLRDMPIEWETKFGGISPPDELLTPYEIEAKAFQSEHEALVFAQRHEMAVYGRGYQAEAHLSPTQVLRHF